MLTCTKCTLQKDLESFPFNKNTKSGRGSWCRECKKQERIDRELRKKHTVPETKMYRDYLNNEKRKWLQKIQTPKTQ